MTKYINMKKISIFIVLILSISLLIYFYSHLQNDYKNKVENVDRSRIGGNLLNVSNILSSFPHFNFNLPDSLKSIAKMHYKDKNKQDFFIYNLFNDPFVTQENSSLLYVPLYNRISNKKEAFILISAGVDGKLDSNFQKGDTIYEDSFFNEFKFYNEHQYNKREYQKFNIFSYLWGKKDYLVWYYNCHIQNMKKQMPHSLVFYENKRKKITQKQSLSIVGTFYKDTIIDHEPITVLKSWEKLAFCKLRKQNINSFIKGDTIAISGFFEKFDKNGVYILNQGTIVDWNFTKFKSRFDRD